MIRPLAVTAIALGIAACGSPEGISRSDPAHTLVIQSDVHDITECLIDTLQSRADIVQFIHPTENRAKLTGRSAIGFARTYFWQISIRGAGQGESSLEYRDNKSNPFGSTHWGYVKDAIDACAA